MNTTDAILDAIRGGLGINEITINNDQEQEEEFPGLHPAVSTGINLARQWATANGIPLEVTETVRPDESLPEGGDPNSLHYARNGARAADLSWNGLQWGDANFNGIADYLESQGYSVIRDAHGTGPHVHFSWQGDNAPETTDTAPVAVASTENLTDKIMELMRPKDINLTDKLMSAMNQNQDNTSYNQLPDTRLQFEYPEYNKLNDAIAATITPPEQPAEADFAGTIPARPDGQFLAPVLNAGLNAISSVAHANAEKDQFIKKQNPDDNDPLWMKAARFVDDFATTPGSMGLSVINQFARPEAAVGALIQHAWDYSQGKPTQDKSALDAAWRGFITNNSDTTRMFKDMGMSDTQAFWANLGRQIIDDPLIVAKPAMLVAKAQKLSKSVGLTDKVMPTVVKLAQSETGKRIENIRDFIMGNRPTEEMIDVLRAAQSSDIYAGGQVAEKFKNIQKGMNAEQRELLNLAQQSTNNVTPIRPIPANEAIDIVDMYKSPSNNPYGKLPQAIVDGTVTKEQAISAFLQQGEEVPRFLLDDRQYYLYKKALSELPDTPATILVPDAISRSNYLGQLEKAGVNKQTIGEIDGLIDAWQQFNHNRFGKAIAEKGVISDETFVRYLDGTHLKRAYEAYNNPEKFLKGVIKNGTVEERMAAIERFNELKGQYGSSNKIPLNELIERQNLSPETMKKLGLITDAEYNIMNTVKGSSNVLRKAEYLENVAQAFGKNKAEITALEQLTPGAAKGFVRLDGAAYGALNGKYVPVNVAEDINNVMGLLRANPSKASEILWNGWQKVVGVFKVEKLVDIPPIFRNFYSGLPMANSFGDVSLVGKNGSPMVRAITDVTMDLFNHMKGARNTLVNQAKQTGLLGSSWTAKEAEALLNYEGQFRNAGVTDKIKWLADKGMQAFGSPDEFWRLVVFDHHLKQGKSVEEAAKIARTALLDYNKSPQWVNFLSQSGIMPFARFPWLAGVETAKALYRNPATVTKYTKPFKGSEADDRNKVLPKYLRGSELMPIGESTRIINGKSVPVKENLDMNNILPFFNEFYLGNPLTELVQIYRTGKASNGMTIVNDNMTPEDKTRAYAKYFRDSFGPSITSSYGWPSKLSGAMTGEVDYKGRMYSPKDAVMQTFGLRNVPVNYRSEVDKREQEMRSEVNRLRSRMRQVDSDKSLTKEQRKQSLAQYEREIANIDKQYYEMRKAYKRLK